MLGCVGFFIGSEICETVRCAGKQYSERTECVLQHQIVKQSWLSLLGSMNTSFSIVTRSCARSTLSFQVFNTSAHFLS